MRVALALLALAAIALLAVGLRASGLESRAAAELARLEPGGDPAPALDLLRSAGRLQPGADARVREALALVIAGRRRQAARLAERAVELEPENVEAWGVLLRASEGRDPERAAAARRRLRELNPQAPGRSR